VPFGTDSVNLSGIWNRADPAPAGENWGGTETMRAIPLPFKSCNDPELEAQTQCIAEWFDRRCVRRCNWLQKFTRRVVVPVAATGKEKEPSQ